MESNIGAEWVQDPAGNWLIGSTLISVSGGELRGIGLQTNSHSLMTDWVKIIGANAELLYFDDFNQSGDCGIFASVSTKLCGNTPLPSLSLSELQADGCTDSTIFAVTLATRIYEAYRDSLSNRFFESYLAKCLEAVNLERFTVEHRVNEYRYTLYYYDRAGNYATPQCLDRYKWFINLFSNVLILCFVIAFSTENFLPIGVSRFSASAKKAFYAANPDAF